MRASFLYFFQYTKHIFSLILFSLQKMFYLCSDVLDWYTIELFVGILLRYHLHTIAKLTALNARFLALARISLTLS